jgi:hypothetical protein
MPGFEAEIDIRCSRERVYEIAQDYYIRTEWDPFTR